MPNPTTLTCAKPAAPAYVRDPHKQVDPFGLSGTCPLAGARRSNPWIEFQRRAKGGQFKNSKDVAKAYRHFQNGGHKELAELIDLSPLPPRQGRVLVGRFS